MDKFGYRNVWYDTRKKCMHLWAWDEKGNRTHSVEPFSPYLYVETSKTSDAVSIFDTHLKKLSFPSQFERRRYVRESGIKRFFHNLQAEQQFLLDRYFLLNDELDFSKNPVKTYFIDIETYSPNEFPVPEKALHPINLITVYDSLTGVFHTFGTKPYISKSDNMVYYYKKTEHEMLKAFLEFWCEDYCENVSGWNSERFDIPYIINRIINVLGNEYAKKLSPVNSLYYKENILKDFGKVTGKWIIHGMNNLDYMEVYKKFARDKRESYSLNYIGEVEGVGGKVKFNAVSLAKLSETDWSTFVDYNIQDVNILVELEKKLQFLKTMRILSHKGFCNTEDTLGKIMIISGAIAAQAFKHNKIFCTFENEAMGDYEGGFVKDIEPGLYESVVTFDANSLYPNCILTLNISPETKIGKIIDVNKETDEIIIKLANNNIHTLTKKQFINFIDQEKLSISSAKVLYTQNVKGIVPEYIDGLYQERVTNKNEKEKLERIIYNEKLDENSERYLSIKTSMEQYDFFQYVIKILLNSIYGVLANLYSPLYDIDNASSVTLTGQTVIKQGSDILNKYAKEKYGVEKDIAHYNDTDSAHCSIQHILSKLNATFFNEDREINDIVYTISNELNDILNDGIEKWSIDRLNSIDPRFFFKREAICPTGLYEAKKHYILHIMDKGEREPLPCDIIKPVGVELVKTTMSQTVKDMLAEIVESILRTHDKDKVIKIYKEKYEQFNKLSPDDIAFRTAIKTYDKYNKMSEGFSLAKRTPAAVAGSIYYNNLLEEYDLKTKYETLTADDRVRWVYISTNNRYNINKIAFTDDIPKEFESFIKIDYDLMFKKLLEPAIKRLFKCTSWRLPNLQAEYVNNLFDLFGE